MRPAAGAGTRPPGLALALLLVAGCQRSASAPAERPVVGGLGRRLVAGPAANLRLSRDGAWATFLRNPARPALEGVNPDSVNPKTAQGELVAVSLADGSARTLARAVTNRPGAALFSPDGQWLLFLADLDLASGTGTLYTQRLGDGSEPEPRGRSVSFVTVSPDGHSFAFIDGGVLQLAPLERGSTARAVAGEISTARFALGGRHLVALRRASAGGGLLISRTGGAGPVNRLAEQVADYELSADGARVAFTQASPGARDVWDLWVAALEGGKPTKVATGVGLFGFSPDGRWLGRIEGKRNALGRVLVGTLLVGPASGAAGRAVGSKVGRFGFSPDGSALWALDGYNEQHDRGTLLFVELPEMKVHTLNERAHTGEWGRDGRFLAFNVEVLQPLPSMDLYLYRRGEEKASRVKEGVYGFGIGPGEVLFFRSDCLRQAQRDQPRACWLNELDLSKPDQPARQILEGIYSFKASDNGERILVSYARMDSDTYDTAVYNRRTGERRTLDTFTLLPALFTDPEGKRVVYLVADRDRSGLYLCDQGP
ncbi:MAG TPA: gliding motility protein [Myxococcaceae bacterium]|nr:gliding motility protein [Myxococcaceae bacterium]